MKIKSLLILFLSIIILGAQFEVSANAKPVVSDLNKYIDKNAKNASAYEKLKIISGLLKERRLKGKAHSPLITGLILEHIYTKGGPSPIDKLKAYEEAISMEGIIYLPFIQSILIEDVLIQNEAYQKGNYEAKLRILIDLDKQQGLGTRFWAPQIERILAELMLSKTNGLSPGQIGLRQLEALKELKEKGIVSSWIGSLQEEDALSEHLWHSKFFMDKDLKKKIAYIQDLSKKELISVFTMTKFETPFYIRLLWANQAFVNLSKAEKRAYIQKEEEEGNLHMFTASNILESLDLE